MKNFKQIVACTFSLCLLATCGLSVSPSFSTSTKLTAKAQEPLQHSADIATTTSSTPSTYLDNFATDYFTHLTTNTAYNKTGSCGYVAISCFLSFYDTYWNDGLIPETYDQPSSSLDVSPGVRDESIFESMSNEEYYEKFSSNHYNNGYVETYFQFLLFKLMFQDQSTINYGVNYDTMQDILNTYLFEYLQLSTNQYALATISNEGSGGAEAVKDFAINYVKQGRPVIVGIPGHVTVAYDYDEATDTLYGYWGYRFNQMHYSYTSFSDAYIITLGGPHVHSDNYILNGVETCSCQLDSHEHDFTYNYKATNATQHKAYCYCGEYITEEHSYRAGDIHNYRGDRYANCTYCGYRIDLPDDTIIPVLPDLRSIINPSPIG